MVARTTVPMPASKVWPQRGLAAIPSFPPHRQQAKPSRSSVPAQMGAATVPTPLSPRLSSPVPVAAVATSSVSVINPPSPLWDIQKQPQLQQKQPQQSQPQQQQPFEAPPPRLRSGSPPLRRLMSPRQTIIAQRDGFLSQVVQGPRITIAPPQSLSALSSARFNVQAASSPVLASWESAVHEPQLPCPWPHVRVSNECSTNADTPRIVRYGGTCSAYYRNESHRSSSQTRNGDVLVTSMRPGEAQGVVPTSSEPTSFLVGVEGTQKVDAAHTSREASLEPSTVPIAPASRESSTEPKCVETMPDTISNDCAANSPAMSPPQPNTSDAPQPGERSSADTAVGPCRGARIRSIGKNDKRPAERLRGRASSPRPTWGYARQPMREAGDPCSYAPPITHSPREDWKRPKSAQKQRSTSQEDLRTVRALDDVEGLQREVDTLRSENAKLQEKLCKARSQAVAMQKQAEEARADRDKEHQRAEESQRLTQQLQRQLRRETAKAHLLERTINTATSSSEHFETETADGKGNLDSPRGQRVRTTETAQTACDQEQVAHDAVLDEQGPAQAALPQDSSESPSRAAGMTGSWEFVVQGQHDAAEQADFAPKLVSCFPDDAVERSWRRGAACICSRGRRRDKSVPNQDDFLIARHTLAHAGHIALYGVFDGHGPAGHHCAAFARGSLPDSLFGQHTLLTRPEETLRQAFRHTQTEMLQQPFDTEWSGTTAALALVLHIPSPPFVQAPPQDSPIENEPREAPENRASETWLFVAHVGDSRIILASHRENEPESFSVTALTRDHRPDDTEEAERIQRDGGEVRRMHKSTGAFRVFAPRQDRPALALTRSLGASGSTYCGVSSEPEVSAYRLRPSIDVLLILGTDGLFEFCDNTDAAGKMLRNGVTVSTLKELCGEAQQRWAQSSYNDTVDDVTAISVLLPVTNS